MSDPLNDPKLAMREALQEIRNALVQARDSVVLMVMRRNKVQEEVNDLERLVADLDQKAALAERINNMELATELRAERDSRRAELDRARARLGVADADAEAAKANLPRQEAQLQAQANDLQIRLNQMAGQQIGAEAEESWERATDKIRNLENQLSARAELAGRPIEPSTPGAQRPTPDQSADQMLSALESRLGLGTPPPAMTPETPAATGSAESSSLRYLEFDLPKPAETPPAAPVAPEAPTVPATPMTPEPPANAPVQAPSVVPDLADIVSPEPPPAPPVSSPFLPQPVSEPAPEPPIVTMPQSTDAVPPMTAEAVPQEVAEPEVAIPSETEPENETSSISPQSGMGAISERDPHPQPLSLEGRGETDTTVWSPQDSSITETSGEHPQPESTEITPDEENEATAVSPLPGSAATEAGRGMGGKGTPQNMHTVETSPFPVSAANEVGVGLALPSKGAGGIGESLAIITSRPQGETSRMEPTQRVRVAAIGTGGIFRGAHLPAYLDIAGAQLVAFCDPDPQAQKLVKARYESLVEAKIELARERKDHDTIERLEKDLGAVQIVSDISEVIANIKPDLVDICTQPFLHAPLSIQALEAGLNVMCEKPISRSWLETERLLATIQRTGKLYQHNENWLWDKDYYTAKKLVDAGAIGEPILMFLATAHGGPEGAGKFWNSDFGGGGALLDNGIHAIGASWYISGLDKKPTAVKTAEPYGMTIRMPNRILDGRFQKVTVDDDAHILIRFENEESGAWTTAHVEGSWSHRDSPDTAIIGTTGKIYFKDEDGRRYAVVVDAYERESRRIEVSGPTWQPWPSSFYGEILNMVECVRHNVPSISSAQFGADCSAVVGAAYLSEKNGREAVTIEEFKTFAHSVADRFPNDPAGADNALIETLLSAVRK